MSTTSKPCSYLIIGNSAAGVSAVEGIRGIDDTGSIVLIGEEDSLAYSRPVISYLVAGDADEEKMIYRDDKFYDENEVSFLRGHCVTGVSSEQKSVSVSNGKTIKWEKLLMATGSKPFIPAIEGLEGIAYQSFVNIFDAFQLLDNTHRAGMHVLIIGAGLIGMKAAEAAHARGSRVTVIEKMGRVLPAAFDDEASQMVFQRCEAEGLRIITGDSVELLAGGSPSRKSRTGKAGLESGHEIDFDLLIIAVGVIPRTELAKDAGIDVNRGILVDEHLETSADGIYAAGDVAETGDIVWNDSRVNALWPNAVIQGKIAGANMAGAEKIYPGSCGMNAVDFFGLPVLSAGIVNPPDEGYEVLSRGQGTNNYRKVVLRDDVIVGMIMAGEIEKAGVLTSLIKEKANVKRYRDVLLDEAFGHIYLPKAYRQPKKKGVESEAIVTE